MSANLKKDQFADLAMPLDNKPLPDRALTALERKRLGKDQSAGAGSQPPEPAPAAPPAPEKTPARFDLDTELHTELKIYAAKRKRKMVDIVQEAVREYMANH